MHPEKIGPYRIDRKIGSGGMGNVYHGTHEDSGQEVAVKVLPASMAREDGFVQRFSREIHALKKLSSNFIVRLFDDGETGDGSYYYSMEFIDGETLTAMISRRKRIPWREVIDISLDIAAALKSAHDAGIVHRDLKPSNLMVAKDGQIKLTDFGVAHVFATTRLTRTGGVVGTAEYMSPEQASGKRATKRSDLYSLGAVMYVMLTGRPPFTGKAATDILHQHQYSQFDRPSHYVPELPRLLEEYVCTLLEKKPDRRYPDALVAIRKLENARRQIEFALKADETTRITENLTSDHTAGLASDRTQGGSTGEHRPGPATIVRNVLRQDLEQQLYKSPVARFFDNIFVLLALFALVLVVGFYLSRNSTPDPGEQLAQAKQLFEAKPGERWLTARDDILLPLLAEDVFPDKREELQQMVDQADQYEFCRRLRVSLPSDGPRHSEVERLIRQSFSLYSGGEVREAKRQLEAVRAVVADDPRYHYLTGFLTETLEGWDGDRETDMRRQFVGEVLSSATVLAEENNVSEAATLLRSAIVLYEDDSAVEDQIAACRTLLQQLNQDQ